MTATDTNSGGVQQIFTLYQTRNPTMTDFNEIKKHCEANSRISSQVIDQFLIYYAAEKGHLVPQMEDQLRRYSQVARNLDPKYVNFLKSEFIAHRIFKKGGLIHKFLNHSAIKELPQNQKEFLSEQSKMPWRYSVASIVNNPSKAFFDMEDAFTGDEYMLYSEGMQATENEKHSNLWFNLIGFNGKCWQTFGLLIPFSSFSVDDLFFFATELNPSIIDEISLAEEIENKPFPFFMLLNYSSTPAIISRNHEMIYCFSEDVLSDFNSEALRKDFNVIWDQNVYRFKFKSGDGMPHFATIYYDEIRKILTRTSMTEEGFRLLTDALNKAGYELDFFSDIAVSQAMITATKNILHSKFNFEPYPELFTETPGAEESLRLKKYNDFMKLLLPYQNEGKDFDLQALADKAGLDLETARSLWKAAKESADRMKKGY